MHLERTLWSQISPSEAAGVYLFIMISSISIKVELEKDVRLIYLDIYLLTIFLQFFLTLVLSSSLGSASWHDTPLPESPSVSVPNFSRKGPLLWWVLHCGHICSILERDTFTSFHPDPVTLLFLGIFNINQISLGSHSSSIDFCSLFKVLKILLWFLFIHQSLLANP